MPEPSDSRYDSGTLVADTGLFVACGRQQNSKYIALERFARRTNSSLVIPQRVYEEIDGSPGRSTPSQTPIDSAISAGWVTVADEIEYTDRTVSAVMDDVRRYIASASNRSEDQIEKADAALAAVAVQLLTSGDATLVSVVTTDTDAGEGTVSVLDSHGFEGQVDYIDGFEFIERIS